MRNWLLLFFVLGSVFSGKAQVFSWKNPNQYAKDSLKKDSILSSKINREYFTKDTLSFFVKQKKLVFEEGILVSKNSKKEVLENLNTKGSIIRGITFGNNQGQSVQSSMDLQITGKLSKDVSILANISDHNLPIQADGYTQTLQEFDRVYLQLNIKDKNILRAGHLDLQNNDTYFGRFQRRSMGFQFQTQSGNEQKTYFDVSAGVARSEFHRIRFQGIEGNQGPYRLLGKNGENFITILSGSEQVFIDGILMKRGENLDYTINYNTGEITFTTFRPIYRQNFITVSYNYTNRNYNRFVLTSAFKHENEKFSFSLNAFLENDNKNAPLSINLSKEDEQILANAGNDPQLMLAPSGVITAYDVNKTLYRKVANPQGNYYEFSTDKNETLYQVSFTFFGQGKGDYRLKQTTNNGRIFEYVGDGQGEYSAVRKLPAPEKSQVLSGAFAYRFKNGKIGSDFSISNHDVNLFSSKNNKENNGFAGRIYGDKTFTKNLWTGTLGIELQRISSRFHILDRINDVEFSRDFNLSKEFNNITQDRIRFSFLNHWKDKAQLNYKFNLLHEKQNYRGIKNDLDFSITKNKITTKGNASFLKTQSDFQNTEFLRGNLITALLGRKGSWSFGGSMEHNRRFFTAQKTLDTQSFSWKEIFAQKKWGDSTRTILLAKSYLRVNDSVKNNALQRMNNILGFVAESQWIQTTKTQLSTLVHYRKFFYKNQENTSLNGDFLMGNLQYGQQLFRNGMRLQAFYELGNGQEAQREFQYLKVTDGQGIYKWTDYNGDGAQQLDEFEIAEYADLAQYIRVYTNTIKYLPSNKNKLQVSLFINPSMVFNSENQFLKRWNFNLALNAQNAFLKQDRILEWNPFKEEQKQILKNQNLLFSVLFNPTDQSGWNGNYRFIDNQNFINANFSLEKKFTKTHFINIGYWFNKNLRTDWGNQYQQYRSDSEVFSSRNYALRFWETKPKLIYKLNDQLQAEASTAYRNKTRTDGEEKLNAWEASGTLQWENQKTSIRGNVSFIKNDFSGNAFSIIGNQMLDGLKPGKNQVWSLILQQAINSFLQLNVNYEGRNAGERTIHIGSIQVRASF